MQELLKIKKIFLFLFSFSALSFYKISFAMEAQTQAFVGSTGLTTDVSDTTATDIIASIIKVFLGFLGIIFIILIIWAGYNWMTAGGNEEKVTKARTTIFRAMIGLIIIVSSYAITYFVFGALNSSTGP
ncbi:MAG: hypothetical protein PF572_05580 [Patescibacteria group bacterium]|jgi:TRAP-type C4-dicarboxylate transport system permease small subunit|nr:hypothetical protein [Patescibacteria group bacterium]